MESQSVYTGNEDSEIVRIGRQNEYLNRVAAPYLDEVFAACVHPAVLDVGCADGKSIVERLGGRDYAFLLGIDKNPQKIAAANERLADERKTFLCLDVETDAVVEELRQVLANRNRTGFDVIHVASALLHMQDVQQVLDRLYGLLVPGGWLFIQDEDDGFNMVYPHDDSFDDCFYAWDHSLESGDRAMGRKIPYMLQKSGYEDIRVLSTTINSTDFNGEMKETLWDLYFNSDLWAADDPSFYDNEEAYRRFLAYRERHAALREAYRRGEFFAMIGFLYMTARKK